MKKIISVMLMFILLNVNLAYAAVIDQIMPNYQNNNFEITASFDHSDEAVIYVAYYDDISGTYKTDGIYAHTVGSNKKIENLEIPIRNTDKTEFRIGVSGIDHREISAYKQITFYSSTVYNNALAMLKDATRIDDLFEDITYKNEKNCLILQTDRLDLIPVGKRAGVYSVLCSKANSYADLSAEFADFQQYFSLIVSANAISAAATDVAACELFNRFADELGIKASEYYVLMESDNFDDTIEQRVAASLRGKTFNSQEVIKDAFEEGLLLNSMKTLKNYSNATTVLKQFQALLPGINFAGYDALGSVGLNVDSAVAGKEYESVTALVEAYNKAVSNPTSDTDESVIVSRPSDNGGGGGGGGGNNIISVPTPKPEEDNQDVVNSPQFNDLAGYEWAKTAIEELAKINCISGYGNGRFNPGGNITREEFIKLICVLFEIETNGKNSGFSDVNDDEWFSQYVKAAADNGIVQGIGDGRFGVGLPITRQEMAVIIARAMELQQTNEPTFTDNSEIADWALVSIGQLQYLGVINGDDGKFKPLNYASRAETACMLYRVSEIKK